MFFFLLSKALGKPASELLMDAHSVNVTLALAPLMEAVVLDLRIPHRRVRFPSTYINVEFSLD